MDVIKFRLECIINEAALTTHFIFLKAKLIYEKNFYFNIFKSMKNGKEDGVKIWM